MKPYLLLYSLSAASVVACAGSNQAAADRSPRGGGGDGPIVIGAAWPWQSRQNLLYWQGMEMALDQINADGGIRGRPLRILREDDGETVDRGRAVAQKFAANPNVIAVIGHMQSFITLPAAAIYELAGVLLVSPTSTDPSLTEQGYKLVFRTTFTDRQVGAHLGVLAGTRGYRRVAIYYIRDGYGRGLANAFEETFTQQGGMVVDRQSYDPNEAANRRPVEQVLHDWKGRDLDAIFIAGEAPQAALLISEARRQGLRVPVLGGDALGTPEFFAVDSAAVEGATIAASFHPGDPSVEVQKFAGTFRKRYGRLPDSAAAVGYDALRVLAAGMARADKVAPPAIAAALRQLSRWPGVTGTFTFSETGDVVERTFVTIAARDGRFVFLTPGATVVAGTAPE